MSATPRSRFLPWWLAPFVGAFVALAGLCVTVLIVGTFVGLTVAKGCGEAMSRALADVFDRWVPPNRVADLDVAPGAPGYVALGMAGRQLHYHDTKAGVTSIAVEVWGGVGMDARIVVARYDGTPTTTLDRALLQTLDPILPMIVVRAVVPGEVRWTSDDGAPNGPLPVGADGVNLLVEPGRVALWIGDTRRGEIEVGPLETVRCTLGPGGLVVEERR